jgi:hypothetical protein
VGKDGAALDERGRLEGPQVPLEAHPNLAGEKG